MWKFRDQCCQKEISSFLEMATISCSLTWGFQEIPCETQGPDFSNSSPLGHFAAQLVNQHHQVQTL